MSIDSNVSRSRRSLLAAAAGAAAATAATGLTRPLATAADTGDPLVLGQTNTAAELTRLDGQLRIHGEGHPEDRSHTALRVTSAHGAAVRGESSGFGHQHQTAGVIGVSTSPGFAISAIGVPGGWGLYVRGRVLISNRSGRATVPAGKSSVDVDLSLKGGVSGNPLCFANVMSYRPGVFVTMVRVVRGTQKIRIHLNRTVSSNTFVAWLVLS